MRRQGLAGLAAQVLQEEGEFAGERPKVTRSDACAERLGSLSVSRKGEGVGEIGQAHAGAGGERLMNAGDLALEIRLVAAAENEDFVRPVLRARRPRLGAELALILLEHRVEVCAAETEGAGRAAARVIGVPVPGTRLLQEINRAVFGGDGRDRRIDAEMRRQDLVMQRQRDLDEAGDAGGAFGVAQNRLHRTDGAILRRRAE